MWMINTEYDQESFFGRNAYFLGVDPSAWLESGPARRAQNRLFPPVPSETNPCQMTLHHIAAPPPSQSSWDPVQAPWPAVSRSRPSGTSQPVAGAQQRRLSRQRRCRLR